MVTSVRLFNFMQLALMSVSACLMREFKTKHFKALLSFCFYISVEMVSCTSCIKVFSFFVCLALAQENQLVRVTATVKSGEERKLTLPPGDNTDTGTEVIDEDTGQNEEDSLERFVAWSK